MGNNGSQRICAGYIRAQQGFYHKSGDYYLIQSHVSIIFLLLGFVWVAAKTGSYDFEAISRFSHEHSGSVSLMLFIFFFIGFAIKSGFVPFHTWLPYAHPAAPAHVSGIMSGVLIKIGIYGILRIILLQNTNLEVIGYIIITFSAISGYMELCWPYYSII
jgi:formate hydrogenlyase subunit 3/multisubunit Na+/H+ antiporter MnhD subunit